MFRTVQWAAGVIAVLVLIYSAMPARTQTAPGVQAAANGRQYTPPLYVFSPSIPHDMVTHDVGAIGLQPFADILAWQTFIALNWPVPDPIAQRGIPDQQNIIGGFVTKGGEGGKGTSMPSGPTVWETYKDTADIYLNPPVRPTPFDAPEKIPAICAAQAAAHPEAAEHVLTMTSKFDPLFQGNLQADGNRLVDQNGQDVWYDVKLNRTYYDYVVNNGFYNSKNQQGKKIAFPYSSNTTANQATIKVKAAWKIMGLLGSKQPDDPSRFYTTTALILDTKTKTCDPRLVGLVGLHVVMKTKQLPQWLWATFEQVDNAPDEGAPVVPGKKYNFNNPACTNCPVNVPPGAGDQTPTQVVRVVPVDSAALGTNSLYQAALHGLRPDNVWQYYELVNAQWGATATPLGVPNQPKYLANTTLETYLQETSDPEKDKFHGCINCHGAFAGATDLDFQLTNAYPRSSLLSAVHGGVAAVPGVAGPR